MLPSANTMVLTPGNELAGSNLLANERTAHLATRWQARIWLPMHNQGAWQHWQAWALHWALLYTR